MDLSIIIPSWRGAALLSAHLDGVVAEAKALGRDAEVVVVDDASDPATDDSEAVVQRVGAPARLVRVPVRQGFGGACNFGANASAAKYLLFLNNDIQPAPGSVAALVTRFEARPDVFAAVPSIRNAREGIWESAATVRVHHGVFEVHQPGRVGLGAASAGKDRPTAYPCGGAALVRRAAFLRLGGFSPLFAPFYWEDADLGWRALREGGVSVECGGIEVLHDHARTIGVHFSAPEVAAIYERNRLLFTWLHLAGGEAWASHLTWFAVRWAASLLRRDGRARAFPRALRRVPGVLEERRRLRTSQRAARDLLAAVRRSGPAGWPALA